MPRPALLLTGGAGYIGRRFVELFHDKFSTIVVFDLAPTKGDLQRFENVVLVAGDVRKPEDLARVPIRVSLCAHLAEQRWRPAATSPEIYFATNVEGAGNVFWWAAQRRLDGVVALSAAPAPRDNGDDAVALATYVQSKRRMEAVAARQFAHPSAARHGARVNFVRSDEAFGPDQSPQSCSNFIAEAARRVRRGTATPHRFVFVDDVCAAFFRLLAAMSPYLGGGRPLEHLGAVSVSGGEAMRAQGLAEKIEQRVSPNVRPKGPYPAAESDAGIGTLRGATAESPREDPSTRLAPSEGPA